MPTIVCCLSLTNPQVGLVVWGEVAAAAVQAVLSAVAATVGVGTTTVEASSATGTAVGALGITAAAEATVVVVVASTWLHGAPFCHMQSMCLWLSCTHMVVPLTLWGH